MTTEKEREEAAITFDEGKAVEETIAVEEAAERRGGKVGIGGGGRKKRRHRS